MAVRGSVRYIKSSRTLKPLMNAQTYIKISFIQRLHKNQRPQLQPVFYVLVAQYVNFKKETV